MTPTLYLGTRRPFLWSLGASLALWLALLVATAWAWGPLALWPMAGPALALAIGLWRRRSWARQALIAALLAALLLAVTGLGWPRSGVDGVAAALRACAVLLGAGLPCLALVRWLRSAPLRQAFAG